VTPAHRLTPRSALAIALTSVVGLLAFAWPFFVDDGTWLAESPELRQFHDELRAIGGSLQSLPQ